MIIMNENNDKIQCSSSIAYLLSSEQEIFFDLMMIISQLGKVLGNSSELLADTHEEKKSLKLVQSCHGILSHFG